MGRVFFHMEYRKPHLSIHEQIALLIERGLVADTSLLEARLINVGYYRLSAYLHPFRRRTADGRIEDDFVPGTTLDKVWNHYLFDRHLRFMMMDAIERIEVALRSRIAFFHTEKRSPFAYAQQSYFPHWKGYEQGLERFRIHRNKQGNIVSTGKDYVDHFFETYGDKHEYLPLWMAVGEMDFGTIVYFYSHSEKAIRKAIAREWGLDTATLSTWLTSLRVLRNDCAHHARIWNKTFLTLPHMKGTASLPWDYVYSAKAGKWVRPTGSMAGEFSLLQSQAAIAPLLFICRVLLKRVAPTSQWHIRMEQFLLDAARHGIVLQKMGLPENWNRHPLWK